MCSPFKTESGCPAPLASEIASRLRPAMARLREAFDYAHDLELTLWDFAVEIQSLLADGLSKNDLRWLVCKGYVRHAGELTPRGSKHRAFRSIGRLNFCKRTCFVLTEEGAGFALQIIGRAPCQRGPCAALNGHAAVADGYADAADGQGAPSRIDPPAPMPLPPAVLPHLHPCWDRDRQELRVGAEIVKQFKVPAPNQEAILAAFQEEGWPHRIDDPIPPEGDKEPKRRLHDTINSLNRSQRTPLVRFHGDGSGQGVRWEPADHALWGGVGRNGHHSPWRCPGPS